ncbi:MAG: hypothetical protein ACKVZJ_01590 [Phycisphaerales bacterium]
MAGTGFAAFMLCSMMWIGFDQPLGITALRLAAIYAIVDAVLVGFELIPGFASLTFLSWLLALGLFITLMTNWLELETKDAIAVAFVSQFIRVGLLVALAMI